MYWKLNRIMYPVYNLGPGKRIGIWVQGCSINCEGCISIALWDKKKGTGVNVIHLANKILHMKEKFDGITITGGEPFDQYEALIVFSSLIKMKSNLNLFLYTGYDILELENKYKDKAFLKYIDFLIDGRFINNLLSTDNIRGSTNQNIYKIEDYKYKLLNTLKVPKMWSLFAKNKSLFLSGIPAKNDLIKIKKNLQK